MFNEATGTLHLSGEPGAAAELGVLHSRAWEWGERRRQEKVCAASCTKPSPWEVWGRFARSHSRPAPSRGLSVDFLIQQFALSITTSSRRQEEEEEANCHLFLLHVGAVCAHP